MFRKVTLTGILTTMALLTAACGGGGSESAGPGEDPKETLVVVDWGGAVTEARKDTIFKPFEEKFGVNIEVESPTDYGKFKAMVEGGNVNWDVVNVDTFWAEQAGKQGLVEPIDYKIVDKEHILPEMANEYSVGAEMYSSVIAYSTEAFSEDQHPKTWEDFWNVDKFPGARGLYNSAYETLEIALLADGVKPEDLYPLDIDRAFKSLDKLAAKTEIVWWDAGAQPVELLSSGTVTVSTAWNGRITEAKKDNVPVDLHYNQATLASESWAIPKGSKNKELAMEFINFATSAEVQAAFSETIDYSPVNQKAIELLPAEVQERLGQSPELAKTQVIMDPVYWAEHYDEVSERLQEWHLKQ
ncbi:ABC transporter substrate-binding protein [Siminovitchia sediminis]|uniref:ABC transporter substrate-binding protein n=1 Tax=Siminovitchia sediminis TaxID=1274353 RepID=A0ABW4KI29_9BACI